MMRDYREDDLEALLDVWDRASDLGHAFLSPEFRARERTRIPEVYLPLARTRVWEENGRVVGFIALVGNEIGGLFVHPGAGRRGIGAALVEWARSRYPRLEVEVFDDNAVGRAFYEGQGFTRVGAPYVHEETGRRCLRMELEPRP